MQHPHYLLVDGKYNHEVVYLDYDRLTGFQVHPRNKIKNGGIIVNKMVLINPSFIENVVHRKISKQLKAYLKYVVELLNTTTGDDEEDGAIIEIALNDLDRFRRTFMNKYRKYLQEKEVEYILKKIKLLERELRIKQAYIFSYVQPVMEIEEEEKEVGRRHR